MDALIEKIRRRVELRDRQYAEWEAAEAKRAKRKPGGSWAKFLRSDEWKKAREECFASKGRVCVA